MAMTLQEYASFAEENPVCFLATLDGNQPRVRAFRMWFADESGFYFHTGPEKEVYRQLQENQKVEVCFYSSHAARGGRMMRVAGEVEFLDSSDLKAKLIEERPYLQGLDPGERDRMLAIFRIHRGEAHFWTLADTLREPEIEKVRF
jgi:pyridoxamine 5'-phosphate oxidase